MSTDRDERIVATRQRWLARGCAILIVALGIDLIVRSLILKQDPRQYLDIGLIWMGTMLYVAIGMTASGVDLYGGERSKIWLLILVLAAGVPVLLSLLGMELTPAHFICLIIVGGASACAGVFLMLRILRGIYGAWERRTLGRGPREE
jgi:hypothetical protein